MLKTTRDAKSGGRKITFTLPAEEHGTVSVVGNFNDWTPGVDVLKKRGQNKSASVVVPADYIAVFRYLGEGGVWFDEPEASFVDAGASVLLPPEPKAPAKRATKAAAKPVAKAAETVKAAAETVKEAAKSTAKSTKAPAKSTKAPAKATKAPAKAEKTPTKATKAAPKKAAK